MDSSLKNQFLRLWETYFPGCELPIAFYYDTHPHALPLVKPPQGHRCLLAQLHKVRNGESLCFTPQSVGCGGGKRYLGYAETIRPDFEYFLSHGKEGQPCERYKRTPEQVTEILSKLPLLPRPGDYLICKRWDRLEEEDRPVAVFFLCQPDTLSGLFTWASFDSTAEDAVICPFGAGCTSIFYYPYREALQPAGRAVLGMFDPSARKCLSPALLSFAVPMNTFEKMIGQAEETFLITDTWQTIRKRMTNN